MNTETVRRSIRYIILYKFPHVSGFGCQRAVLTSIRINSKINLSDIVANPFVQWN